MARKTAPTILQEELYPLADEPAGEDLDDARLLDLEVEQESPFLRGQKRVSARRGSLPKKTASRLIWATAACGALFLFGIAAAALYRYGERSWRFRVESSDNIEITGLQNVPRGQVMEVMGGDIGRNIFFVPLAQRKAQLEQIPWVESASVMRFVPNRLRVQLHERAPIAFARVGSRILLIDAAGTLMELPGKKKYSFPVILGMNSGEPLSTRAARMKIYSDLVSQLDSGGARYTQDLSEVDLSDPEDVKVLANNPEGDVLVHLGSANYLERYKVYVGHVKEWRQQFDKLESVDLRYERQIIVNPDVRSPGKPAPLSLVAAKAAMSAGVKPAALIHHVMVARKPTAAIPVATPGKIPGKPAALRPAVKKRVRRWKPPARRAKTRPNLAPATAATTTTATTPPVQTGMVKTSSMKTMKSVVGQTGKKPSPAITKEQEHR